MTSLLFVHGFPDREYISVTQLPESGHYYYSDSDRATIIRDFSAFISSFI